MAKILQVSNGVKFSNSLVFSIFFMQLIIWSEMTTSLEIFKLKKLKRLKEYSSVHFLLYFLFTIG